MNRRLFVIVSLALFVIGLIVVADSVSWGSAAANAYLQSQGGSMDTVQLTSILQEYIHAFRTIGTILSVLSGIGILNAIEMK